MNDNNTMTLPVSADGKPLRPGSTCYVRNGNINGHDTFVRQRIDAVDEMGVWFGGRRRDAGKVYASLPETMDGLMSAMASLTMPEESKAEAMLLLEAANRLGAQEHERY